MTRGKEVSFALEDRPMSAEVFRGAPGAPVGGVLAHGAGGDRSLPFLRDLAERLALSGVPTALYNFPYREAGRRRPDPEAVLEAAALAAARELVEPLGAGALVLGGKSMGGRIAAQVVARGSTSALPAPVVGLVFLGYPLHRPGADRPEARRAEVLRAGALPLLFVQGSRDRMCRLDWLDAAIRGLKATLHVVRDGDHSLGLPRRAGRSEADVLVEVTGVIVDWLRRVAVPAPQG